MKTTITKESAELFSFQKALEKSVSDAIEKIFDRHIEEATKEAQEKRQEIIANAAMRMSSWYNFENLGKTLRIEVRNPEAKS